MAVVEEMPRPVGAPARAGARARTARVRLAVRARLPALGPRASGLALVAAAAVCFGFLGVFVRIAYDEGANVSGVVALRALAFLPFGLVLLAGRRAAERRRAARRVAAPLAGMVAGAAVAQIAYLAAVDRMAPALVTLVLYVYPALTVLGSSALGWTRLEGLTVLAIVATMGGVALTVGLPDGGVDPVGVLLALANGVAVAVFFLSAQPAVRATGAVTSLGVSGGVVGALLLPGSFLVAGPELPTSAAGLAALAGLAVVSTALAALLQLAGVRRLGSAAGSLVASLEIVTIVAAGAAVFGDPLTAGVVGGSALVIGGAVLAPLASRPRTAAAPARAR
jgi:drug/metabolite transporter (DMT)-like permease